MEKYTDFLLEYLEGRRDISKKLYLKGNRFYRAIKNGTITLDYAEQLLSRGGID